MLKISEFENKTNSEIINFIKNEVHPQIVVDLNNLENDFIELDDFLDTNITLIKELFKQFKNELISHIEKEHNKYFKYLFVSEGNNNYHYNEEVDLVFMKTMIRIEKTEHKELKSYLSGLISVLRNNNCKQELINKVEKITEDIKATIKLEHYLIKRVAEELGVKF